MDIERCNYQIQNLKKNQKRHQEIILQASLSQDLIEHYNDI